MRQYIIITGNPVQGFSYVGPFNDNNDAVEAAIDILEADWWVAELIHPGKL
jgi:hypothetical protein